MKKQLISFTDPQAEYLENEAKRLGVSIAELVRRAVDWYRDTYPLLGKEGEKKTAGKEEGGKQ